MSGADAPEVAEEIARLKKALDRQAVMAVVGMVVIAGVMVFHPGDFDRTVAVLKEVLPWLVGVSALVVAANRAQLAIQTKSLRRRRAYGSGT